MQQSPRIFRMPFPAGTAVLCQQGNHSPTGWSHSWPNCLHAIDFAGIERRIVAAADGEVIAVFAGAKPGFSEDGVGFGNSVKVLHEDMTFTFYAHLEEVSASIGERVSAGTLLGTMGDTGKAGDRHLHFSRHSNDVAIDPMGVGATIPIEPLLTIDLTAHRDFALTSSEALLHSGRFWNLTGHVYGSENAVGEPPLTGAPPEELRRTLHANFEELYATLKTGIRPVDLVG